MSGGIMNVFHQRPLHTDSVVITGRSLICRPHIIDNINASNKSNLPVYDHNFPVQAAQSPAPQRPGRSLGPELQHQYASRLKIIYYGLRQIDRAESIDQKVGNYAADGRPPERIRNAASCGVMLKNLGFHINSIDRPVQRCFDHRKICFAVLQQGDLIVWNHSSLIKFVYFSAIRHRS